MRTERDGGAALMANQPKLEQPVAMKDRLSAEYLALQKWAEQCHCPKPVEGGRYLKVRTCRLCGARIS